MSAVPERSRGRETVDSIAGLMAAAALVVSFVAVAYRPFRIAPATIILALIAAGIGGRHKRLAAIAVGVAGACWLIGMVIAIATRNPVF